MANVSELPLSTRVFLKAYPWRRIDPVPWSPLTRPLSESRVALVSTAGLVLPNQEPFDDHVRGGDSSFREIPSDADTRTMIDSHRSASYDHSGVHADANLAFPIDRIRELADEGTIGSVNHRHFSLMGSITAPGRLKTRSAKTVANALAADGVDAVLLVPIWPMCNQAVCLLAAEIERHGIGTVCVMLLREVAEKVRPPRALAVPFAHGYPLGAPNDAELQREVMMQALRLVQREGPGPVIEDYPLSSRA